MSNKTSKDILKIENEYPVEGLSIDGKQIWPILRIYYFFLLREQSANLNTSEDVRFVSKHFKRIVTLPKNIHSLLRRRDFLVFSDSSEKKTIDGNLSNKLFYYLFKTLGSQNIHYFEKQLGNKLPQISEANPKGISTGLFDLLAYVLSFVIKIGPIDNEEVLEKIYQEVGCKIGYRKVLALFKAYRYIYSFILKYNRPKAIFLSDYYNLSYMAVTYEAKQLGIPVVEFQHGIINKAHPAYNVISKKFGNHCFPDYLYTFGPSVKKEIAETSIIESSRLLSIGHPYLSLLKKQGTPKDLIKSGKYKARFLVTLQWTDERQVIDFCKVVAGLTPDLEYILLPRFWDAAKYSENLPPNARFEGSIDFYKMVQNCDIHVTTYSTTAIEAPFFNKPNILLDFDSMATNYFGRLLDDANFTKYVLTPDQFVAAARELMSADVDFSSFRLFEKEDYEKKLSSAVRSLIKSN